MLSLEFFIECGPGVDSAPSRNRKVTDLRMSIVSKSGSLNSLVPGGSVQGILYLLF